MFHDVVDLLEKRFFQLFERRELTRIFGGQAHLFTGKAAAPLIECPFQGGCHVVATRIRPLIDLAVMGYDAAEQRPFPGVIRSQSGIHHHLSAHQIIVKGREADTFAGKAAAGQ